MARKKLSIDVDVSAGDLARLASADALAAFLDRLGYDTSTRAALTPQAIGLNDPEGTFRHLELLSEDPEGFLRVVFAQLRSVTAKARNDLVHTLGRFSQDHLIVLTKDFRVLEFVLIDKVKRRQVGPAALAAYKPVPKVYSVQRKFPGRLDFRVLRRLTFTQRDGLDQFDKLRSAFEAAVFTGEYYQNRALFADHYLNTRLRESRAWAENPNEAFAAVREICTDARARLQGKDETAAHEQLIEPLWKALGFRYSQVKAARDSAPTADYVLKGADGKSLTVALVYQWDRWLDGPDPADSQTPDENPGASVVSVLERGDAEWVVVTNGKLWRLYSRRAHSRSTNFYEVDLAEALVASAETDPGEAFRYWWLFFRPPAFAPIETEQPEVTCWLDTIAAGSREYAKQVEERLKKRVFYHIVPHLADGFLLDRKNRLGLTKAPTDDELEEIREGSLTLLYRLLFMLYAESRDLLPIRESPYYEKSLRKIRKQIADAAGPAEEAVDDKLAAAHKKDRTDLYDRLGELFAAMDGGDPALNVPTYNGGLFLTRPDKADQSREARIARFLNTHKVPDVYLAQAIDHLGRDPDEKTFEMVFVDYKSLGVRQLGSIYEGLLEFRLRIAAEDLTTVKQKGKEKVVPLSQVKRKRTEVAVRRGEPYLATDKGERKATGSYYTPNHIVEYIVDNAVGPVLSAKLEALRPALREAEKTYQRHLKNLRANPGLLPGKPAAGAEFDARARDFASDRAYQEHKELVERIFDCKVLDPAMGSGHFLVEAVDYVTDKLLDFLNRFPHNPVATALERTRRSILESLTEQGVAVDPDKLTDVHLLKRHVLKRCIYGVDLNPMAVELAKVSLWLDAFTLGAPLSFLDHHLRCGNSLIGEMDLSKHMLPGSRREGEMLRAVTEMLQIGRSADARVEDVKTSQALFDDIEQVERPFRRRLNVNTASHFINVWNVDSAGAFAFDPDLDPERPPEGRERSAEGFLAAQELAEQRRFFHWPLEFPEVFFGIREGTQRQMETRMPPEGGFDAIVGNPPYVRQETIKADKTCFKAAYAATYDATCDLYVYFMQREIDLLRAGGLMSMIVANKWLRANYGRKLRDFLLRQARPESIIDFGHTPIFPDADTFPCVPVFCRRAQALEDEATPPESEVLTACQLPRDDYQPNMRLAPYAASHRERVPTRMLAPTSWSLENPGVQELLAKLRRTCVPLRDAGQGVPRRGILTGYNEAFYIDEATRTSLVRADGKAEDLIKPLIRGRDIDRWRCRDSGMYMITIPSTGNATWPWSDQEPQQAERTFKGAYPSIHKHLAAHRDRLVARQDQGKFWWELRQCDYYSEIESPKIVVQCIGYHSRWAADLTGSYINNKTYLIPSDNLALLAVLNSPLTWWVMWRTFPHMKDEALSIDGNCIEQLPIPALAGGSAEQINAQSDRALSLMDQLLAWEQATLEGFRTVADLAEQSNKVLGWLRRNDEDFIRLARKAAIHPPSSATVTALRKFRRKASEELGHLLKEQLELEKQLAMLVEDAYGLTPEERQLLRDTRPVRDPIDVLEARVADLKAGDAGGAGDACE